MVAAYLMASVIGINVYIAVAQAHAWPCDLSHAWPLLILVLFPALALFHGHE